MRMIRPTASLVSALSFLVFAASAQFAFPATAKGATQQVSVPGTLVISTANDPANLGACGTLSFYEWSDVPNTTSATVNYTVNGKPASESAAAPFHDYMTHEKPPRYAPPGRHWISVGWSYAAGGSPTEPNLHCQNVFEPIHRAAYAPTATVVLTVEVQGPPAPKTDPKVCEAARKKLKVRNKAVSRLLGKLKNAEGKKAKARIRGNLAKAKSNRAKAVREVATGC